MTKKRITKKCRSKYTGKLVNCAAQRRAKKAAKKHRK